MTSVKMNFTKDDKPPIYVNAVSATLFAGDILIDAGYASPHAISGKVGGDDDIIYLEASSTITLAMSPEVASGLVEILKTVIANNLAIQAGEKE
ncbi:MAG: hypothetical protein IM537_17885 [Pseudanabaena sp. M57BS1SP1A06MG]|jgi:hypothetical protein|nr:hypothetical protein [Pseudanabaena sp. M53BS1SP1A06MG]MCA6581998.1 hypothetical protein [Pseudanabaena sp. M34BS1SP1A06MG]MCA6594084.1 hypothetical protein [Pseudanabaena sp. M38BS1SP1A06MG]MCA6602023.1 hypothetical protein [Pseudanabaena sp. M57BS1SP1A06MG]